MIIFMTFTEKRGFSRQRLDKRVSREVVRGWGGRENHHSSLDYSII